VLILWGIILLLFGVRQLAPEEASLVRKAERELEKERRRAERQRRRTGRTSGHPGGIPGAAKEFEHAVQEGVNALLSAATRAIRTYTPPQHDARARAGEPARNDERQRAEDRRYRAADAGDSEGPRDNGEKATARQRAGRA
jgi:hypothetical protein